MPSKASAPFDLLRIFDALAGVNYIVVGGVAATLHGAPRLTFAVKEAASRPRDRQDSEYLQLILRRSKERVR